MVYACRICATEEPGDDKCVYRNDLQRITKEQMGITQDLGNDPTLPHSDIVCPQCHNHDAVYFQDQSKRKHTRMILFYVCTRCNHSFEDPELQKADNMQRNIEQLQNMDQNPD